MRLTDIPDDVLCDVRERGHTDAQIERMTAEEVFTEFCEWNGLCRWGKTLFAVVLDLSEAEKEPT